MYNAESANYASAVFNVLYTIIFTFKPLTRVLENMFGNLSSCQIFHQIQCGSWARWVILKVLHQQSPLQWVAIRRSKINDCFFHQTKSWLNRNKEYRIEKRPESNIRASNCVIFSRFRWAQYYPVLFCILYDNHIQPILTKSYYSGPHTISFTQQN